MPLATNSIAEGKSAINRLLWDFCSLLGFAGRASLLAGYASAV